MVDGCVVVCIVQGGKKSSSRILHLRFDENPCKESVAKLILMLNFKIKIFFYIAFHPETTYGRNRMVLWKNVDTADA